jgi:hypothetical protein
MISFLFGEGRAYQMLARIEKSEGHYDAALRNLTRSVEIAKKNGQKFPLALSYSEIALVYSWPPHRINKIFGTGSSNLVGNRF